MLLAAVGAGAIAGVFVLPRGRARTSMNALITAASAVFVVALAVLATLRDPAPALVLLVAAGLARVVVLSTVNAALQLFLPAWVRGRSLAVYQTVLFGSQAIGGVIFGLLADAMGLVATLLAAAAAAAVGAATIRLWPFIDTQPMDRSPAVFWPEPHLAPDVDPAREAGRRR